MNRSTITCQGTTSSGCWEEGRKQRRRTSALGLCLLFAWLLTASATALWGQAVSTPNQITGTLEFTNTNPDILAILNRSDESPPGANKGLQRVQVGAASTNTSPTFNNSSAATVTSGTTASFEVTSESSSEGIIYNLSFSTRMDGGGDLYYFSSQEAPPLFPEPAPDAEVHIAECASIVEVHFIDQNGLPTTVESGSIAARLVATNQLKALDRSLPAGTSTETLAVQGDGSEYRIDTTFIRQIGSDQFLDLIRIQDTCEEFVTLQCDEIRIVECEVSDPQGGGLNLGDITGEIDMLGEEEHAINGRTLVRAVSGPFNNVRYNTIDGEPSEGTFFLPNLLFSDAVSPARGYRVYGDLTFRLGNAYQSFRTPMLGNGMNPWVFVDTGLVTDLGNTFVLDPGYVEFDLQLAGPPVGPGGSCLEDIVRDADFDNDNDGIPNNINISSYSYFRGLGVNQLATGATFTTVGGSTLVGFEGTFNPASENFEGESQMVLAGLAQEPSIWNVETAKFVFRDTDSPEIPESYLRHSATLKNKSLTHLEIVPGETQTVDHHYCFSELRITFNSNSGLFYNPNLQGAGTLEATDSSGNPFEYRSEINGLGTPTRLEDASNRGMVALCAPAADYTFTPFVTSVNPGGGTSRTELPPIFVPCRCRQICEVTTEIQVSLDSSPQCTAEDSLPIAGTVNSDVDVARIFYTNNGGSEVELCAGCGVDPSFSTSVPLTSCGNNVTVAAVDVNGNRSSVTSTVTRDNQPPTLEGCGPIALSVPFGETGTTVDFGITAADDCSGPVEVTCSPASGSLFNLGETEVTCTAGDACGLSTQCSFPVTVSTEVTGQEWHWSLDEGSGVVANNVAGSGDDGVLVGDPEWTLGQQGNALACGDNAFVQIDDSDTLDLENLTVAVWIRPDALGGNQVLLSKDNTYEFEIGKLGDDIYDLRLNNIVAGQGNTQVKEGIWQHLAATWDGSIVRYYYNGLPDGSAPFAGPLAVNASDVGLCARPLDSIAGLPIFFFEGILDEVHLYNAALSDGEILGLVQTTLSDTTAPVSTAGAPTGPLPDGTTEALLSLTTNEDATCRYSTVADTAYDDMADTFATTGGTAHSTLVSGLVGGFYRYFVRCEDALGNRNATDYEITFGAEEIFAGAAGFWRFDEGSGCTAADAWGNTSGALGPACPTNAPQWTTGALGSGLSFAAGQSVRVPHGPGFGPTNALTVAAWVKRSPATGFHSIADKRSGPSNGYDLYINPGSKAFLRINLATLTGNTVIADGTWHHVVGIYDGNELRLYVDGVLDASSTAAGLVLDAEADLILGEHYSGTSAPLFGELDEVLVYDRALSNSEVSELYLALQ